MLDAVKFQPLPEQRRQQQDERDYWESTKISFQKSLMPLISSWRGNNAARYLGIPAKRPANAQAARLGAKGRAFLQAMAGEFGALEGKYGLPAGLLSSVAGTESVATLSQYPPKGERPIPVYGWNCQRLGFEGDGRL